MFTGPDSLVVFLVIVLGIIVAFGGAAAVLRRRDARER